MTDEQRPPWDTDEARAEAETRTAERAQPEPKGENGEVKDEPVHDGPTIIGQLIVQFGSDGGMGAQYANVKVGQMWAAAELLRNQADAIWAEARAQEIAAQKQMAREMLGVRDHLAKQRKS